MAGLLMVSLTLIFALGAMLFTNEASARYQAAPQRPSCQTSEHRAFDFWVGQWVVYDPNGDVVGSSTIELVLGGCALRESWESVSGGDGRSYTFYDRAAEGWHQTWIDEGGNALYLDGEWTGEAMVLGDGTNRITWTQIDGGSVRQHWETTADGGSSWSTAFDGEYVPARQE